MSADITDLCTKFTNYLVSSGTIPEITKITKDLDTSINDSYKLVHELRETFEAVQNMADCATSPGTEDDLARHDEISMFLEADPHTVLPADMKHLQDGFDIELFAQELQEMKTLLEQLQCLRCDVTLTPTHLSSDCDITLTPTHLSSDCDFTSNLEKTATSLEILSKRLAVFRSIKCDSKSFQKDLLLEDKFHELVNYVQCFSKMVEAKTKITQANLSSEKKQLGDAPLCYDETIRTLIGSINEITYLLKIRIE